MNEPKEYAENIIETIRDPLLVLDSDLRVVSASRSFYAFFNISREETEGQLIYNLGNQEWNIPKLRKLLEEILPENTVFNDYEVEHDFKGIGKRIMYLNARKIYREQNRSRLILLAIEDVTEQKNMINEIKSKNHELQKALSEIKTLRGLLPICAKCKKIREEGGYWRQIESYIENHSEAKFSHGICAECSDKLYGDEAWYKKQIKDKNQ